jgi:hypothetical protein
MPALISNQPVLHIILFLNVGIPYPFNRIPYQSFPVRPCASFGVAGKVFISGWIGQGMRMNFIIGQRRIETRPVVAATVSGPGWQYEVFRQPESQPES